MPKSRSESSHRAWLRIQGMLDEVAAQLAFVETQQTVTEGDLREHLLRAHQRLDELEPLLRADELEQRDLREALLRILEAERRLEIQEARTGGLHVDLASLRAETISRVESHQRQLSELLQLQTLPPRLVRVEARLSSIEGGLRDLEEARAIRREFALVHQAMAELRSLLVEHHRELVRAIGKLTERS